jgi:hypothetical protein
VWTGSYCTPTCIRSLPLTPPKKRGRKRDAHDEPYGIDGSVMIRKNFVCDVMTTLVLRQSLMLPDGYRGVYRVDGLL